MSTEKIAKTWYDLLNSAVKLTANCLTVLSEKGIFMQIKALLSSDSAEQFKKYLNNSMQIGSVKQQLLEYCYCCLTVLLLL